MGILSDILGGVEVVAGAILTATGVGAVAGALLITSGVLSLGAANLGGSVGNFLRSGLGEGLTAAVGLAGGAYSLLAGPATTAAAVAPVGADTTTGAAADVASTAGAAGQTAAATAAPTANAAGATLAAAANPEDLLSPTASAISADADVTPAAYATVQTAAANGTDISALQQANAGSAAGAALNPGTAAAAAQQQTLDAATAVNPNTGLTDAGAPPEAAGGTSTSGALPGEETADQASQEANTASDIPPEAGGTPTSASGGGFFSSPQAKAGLLQAGGQLVSGIGQGIMNKQTMQDEINASQWASKSWENPQLAAQVSGAAATPITVPQGYLARATSLQNMLQKNQQNLSNSTAPTSGNPYTAGGGGAAAPPGATTQGSVPIWELNQTPRGGVI